MTKIGAITPLIKYVGNGINKTFPFKFMYWEPSEINVFLNSKLQTSGYEISSTDITKGGTVIFTTAPQSGQKITIRRTIELKRYSEFEESGLFRAAVANDELNRIVAEIQQIQEGLNRSVKVEVTDDQTPEELLTEVYQKLDSATEIAADARKAANTATTAANNATNAANAATEAAEQAVTDITRTATDAVGQISQTTEDATNSIVQTVRTSEASIQQTITEAIEDVKTQAVNAANAAIDDASTTVTNTATTNLNNYINQTVKPDLQSYVNQANTAKNAAATSASAASSSETNAKSSQTSANQSATNAANSEKRALDAAAKIEELLGYQTIFGGTAGDNNTNVIVGGYLI